jgi:hypothetical protein
MTCERTTKRQNKRIAEAIQFARDWMAEHYANLKAKNPDQYLIRLGLLTDFVTDYLRSDKS